MEDAPSSDREFFDDLHVHRDTLAGWLRVRFPSISDVENLVQESLSRVCHAISAGKVSAPRALLFSTAHNLAVDQVRRQRVAGIDTQVRLAELSVIEDGPTPAETTVRKQELELLTKAIQALPERCRQVLTLRKIYGLSQKEIAVTLGIAEHTVEAHVAQGMRRCAQFFSRLGLP